MAIHRSTGADGCTVTFILIDEDRIAPVSVVGSFNDWTPGAHPFEADPDGSRSVTVVVPTQTDVYFRYLGPDGFWFDDADADEITAEGSVLRASANDSSPESISDSADDSAVSPVLSSDGAPAVDSEHGSTPEVDQSAVHDETGERLETVAGRIDAAESAARELADRDLIDVNATDETVRASGRDG